MKRLLLPLLAALALPTSVNAFPFAKDIIITEDIGTKFIIKKSFVDIKDIFDKSDYIKVYLEFP